ncbi:MAG: sodium:solute symporter family protein [Bacillota bacterium]
MSTQLIVILGYFAIVTVVGLLASRLASSSDDFLLAGRKMGVFICSAAIAGEWIGGTSTIGTAEGGFLYGISAAWFAVANALGTVILAFTLAKLYRRSSAFTVTGFMEQYFGVRCRIVSSVVLTFVMIVVASVQIVAGAALMHTLTGINMLAAVWLTGAVFLVYTLSGGLWAIGYTNVLHVIVMYVGLILGLGMISSRMGGTETLSLNLPAYPYMSLAGAGISNVIAWITASVFAALVAQAAVQPIMGARDENVAQKSALLAAIYITPVGIIAALLGMYARVAYPGIASRTALPVLMMSLPPWAGGVVLAGVLAAILSTVAPCILAAGTLLSKDVYQRLICPAATDDKVRAVSRWFTLACGIIAIIWGLYCKVILDQVYFAYTLRATIAILLLFGVYWKNTRPKSAVFALALTTIFALGWEMAKNLLGRYPYGIHPMYVALVTTCVVVIAGSLVGRELGRARGHAGGEG